ncbi:MAG TPA: GNAT family N-acetyltransferase [Candidatus Paceibacterota bacterium]|nr:GNAT family N-acetyltransferase [Candidatus Paceibacterota bacterium]
MENSSGYNAAESLNETIEILGPDEWQEYKAIRLKAFKTDPTSFGESHEREEKKSENELRALLSDSNYKTYVAKIGDRVGAMVSYNLFAPQHVEHTAMISSVFTDPEFRRKGLGERLMKRVLSDLHNNQKTSRVRLSVGTEHVPAREMYKKLGFTEYGVAKREMKVGGKYYDQVHMELFFEDML